MSKSRTDNYLLGLSSGYFFTFIILLIGFWLTPFILKSVGREGYALYALMTEFLVWLGIADLGMSAGLNIQVAKLTGEKNQVRISQLASTAFFSECIIAVFAAVLFITLKDIMIAALGISNHLKAHAGLLFLCIIVSGTVSVISRIYTVLLISHQKIHYDYLVRLAGKFISVFIIIISLSLGKGVEWLGYAHLIATVFVAVVLALICDKKLPAVKLQIMRFDFVSLILTFKLGVWLSVGAVAGILISNLDRFVIASFVSVEQVAVLVLTGKLYVVAHTFITKITDVARPMLGNLIGEGKDARAFLRYKQLLFVSALLSMTAAMTIYFINQAFVTWWVGKENYGGRQLDLILAGLLILHSVVLVSRAFLSSQLIVKSQSVCRIAEGVLNLLLSLSLVHLLGVSGVMAATLFAGLFTSFWYLPYLVKKHSSCGNESLLDLAFMKLIVFFCLFGLITFTMGAIWPPASKLLEIIAYSMVLIGLALIGVWQLIMDKESKEFLLKLIKRRGVLRE